MSIPNILPPAACDPAEECNSASVGWINIHITGTNITPPTAYRVRYDQFVRGLFKPMTEFGMKAHAALGIAGEVGELVDAIKKEIIYNKPADRDNIIEELGDLRFYMQAIQNLYGISEQSILQHNADKLAARYVGLKYSDKSAIDRADKENDTWNLDT